MFTEQEVFEQVGRLYMQNVKLAQNNAQLAEAFRQATAEREEKSETDDNSDSPA